MKKIKKKNTKKTQRKASFVNYHDDLLEALRNNPEGTIIYLNDALNDEDPKMFFSALADIFEAYKDTLKGPSPAKKNSKKQRTRSSTSRSISSRSHATIHAKKR